MKTYRRLVVALVGILLAGSLLISLNSIVRDIPVVADIESLPVIIIDPGHGGIDGGAVGVGDIVEKDINLDISLALRDMFMVSGFDVIMTRDTDISIHDEGVQGTKKQKTSDLRNRLAIANAQPSAIFISIHQNKFGSASSHGAQMFYGVKNEQSESLAKLIQERFRSDLQDDNTRQIKKAGKDLYLMYNVDCPAVLVECGFLSNPGDAAMLSDGDYRAKIAFTTYAAILEFLGMDTTDGAAIQPRQTVNSGSGS
ncbi:MAG: N-acetylmuramoyl-L-alanine amidase [Oscillospiraceae bacterium]|jgi:N-acetylmuramoyl-L-alanine amidase|nr:N-acetylmuramoyl-L-alanine amidase [Oscillospiraceae bacterium]